MFGHRVSHACPEIFLWGIDDDLRIDETMDRCRFQTIDLFEGAIIVMQDRDLCHGCTGRCDRRDRKDRLV